jgi:hypothetical protein
LNLTRAIKPAERPAAQYLGRLIVEEQQKQNDADIDQRTRLHAWLRRRRVEAARLAVPFRSHDQWLKTKNPLVPAVRDGTSSCSWCLRRRRFVLLTDPTFTPPAQLSALQNTTRARGVEVAVFKAGTPEQIAPTMDAFAIDFEPKADAGDIAAGAGERAHKPRDDHIAGQDDDGNAGTWRFLTSSRAWASLGDKT